jgi:hypothetical protein
MHQNRAILLVVICAILSSAVQRYAATPYTVIDLGEFSPSDVNEVGQVIGLAAGRPAMWKDGVIMPMQDLGSTARPLRWSDATPGVSVGSVTIPTGGIQAAAQWDASGALTLLYTRDQLHGSIANGQNASGVTSGFGGRMDNIYGGPVSSAFRWDTPQSLTILDTQDGQWSESAGIDGVGNVWGLDGQHPVYWDTRGVKHVLPGKSGLGTYPTVVSNHGIAVGVSAVRDSNNNIVPVPMQATIAEGFSPMEMVVNAESCEPRDVNNAGISVGNCWMTLGSPPIPVLWERGAIRRLNLEIPDGVRNFTLTGTSDHGALVGAGFVLEDGPYGYPIARTRGLLFSPVQEPPSLAIRLNGEVFRPGDTLRVALRVQQPGPTFTGDFYFGAILPDGQTALFMSNEGWIQARLDDPHAFSPLAKHAVLSQGLDLTFDPFFAYTFQGGEVSGIYSVFAALTPPDAFSDGRVDVGDLLALEVKPFRFSPSELVAQLSAKFQAIRDRHLNK